MALTATRTGRWLVFGLLGLGLGLADGLAHLGQVGLAVAIGQQAVDRPERGVAVRHGPGGGGHLQVVRAHGAHEDRRALLS